MSLWTLVIVAAIIVLALKLAGYLVPPALFEKPGPARVSTLLITPTPTGEADDEDESEGCLSIPGERFGLRRAERAVLTALDLEGQIYEIDADGWLARIFQHEFDHLNGILYADRLDYASGKEVAKAIKKSKWGVPGNSWMPGVDDLDA